MAELSNEDEAKAVLICWGSQLILETSASKKGGEGVEE